MTTGDSQILKLYSLLYNQHYFFIHLTTMLIEQIIFLYKTKETLLNQLVYISYTQNLKHGLY